MVDYEYKDLFLLNSIEKQLTISYGNTVITNEDLFNQEMTLEESLCSDQSLVFGSCEASAIRFKVANIVEPMKGKWLDVSMVLEGNTSSPFQLGRYKVDSDKFTADRRWKEVVAYDAMYDVINSDVIEWYNKVLPDAGSSMTVKQFRKSFLDNFGIQQVDVSLVNDEVLIKRTVSEKELSGATVIKAICELNGCFGHIGRDGIFHYIHLVQGMQGIFPSNEIFPANNIYPRDPKTTPISKNLYISCYGENFITKEIGKLQIVNGSTGVISSVGDGENCYVIENNFLLSGKTQQELGRIGEKILGKIRGVTYQPFDAECLGNPCFEVGDPVRLSTTYDIVETYILKRTLTGIQALKDSYSSDGVEKYELKVNSTERAVEQLNNRADSLEEDVGIINEDIETINDEIEDINENVGDLHISLQKTESGLQAEVSRAQTAEGNLSGRITLTESEITAEVTRAKGEENILSGRITLTAEQFQTSLTNTKNGLESQITQTASDIRQEVSNETDNLQSQIYQAAGEISQKVSSSDFESYKTQTDKEISQKVSNGGVISEINQSSERIYLGTGQLIMNSGNLQLDSYGNANFSGKLVSPTGTIGGFTIGNNYLSNGSTEIAGNSISAATFSTSGTVWAGSIYGNNSELPIGASGKVRIYSGNCSITCNADSEMVLYAKEHTRIRTESGGYWAGVVFDANASGQFHLRPEQNGVPDCGSTSYHWNNVYANNGTIQTSDRNEKMDIMDMTDAYAEQMIAGSSPKTYKMINGTSGRTHNGLIAQDVEQQLYSMGLTTKDFAGLIMYEKDEEGVPTGQIGYGLRYDEYVPILIKYAQMQNRKLQEMQWMFFSLQGELMTLRNQLGGSL